jgi:hypothetical protein
MPLIFLQRRNEPGKPHNTHPYSTKPTKPADYVNNAAAAQLFRAKHSLAHVQGCRHCFSEDWNRASASF